MEGYPLRFCFVRKLSKADLDCLNCAHHIVICYIGALFSPRETLITHVLL